MKPSAPEDAPEIRAKVFDLMQSAKLSKYGIKIVNGKPISVDEHLKPKPRVTLSFRAAIAAAFFG